MRNNIFFYFFISLLIIIHVSCEMEQEYTVSFHANGASGVPPAPITRKKEYLIFIPLPNEGNLIYEGKYFLGWNTKADGTGDLYFPALNESSRYYLVESNISLYAHWIDALFPSVQNLKLTYRSSTFLTSSSTFLNWDDIDGDYILEDERSSDYNYDGKKFVTYIVLRRATNAGSWTTKDFIPFGISSKPYFQDVYYDDSVGGTFEYIVALGVATKNGLNYDIYLGSHSNITNSDMVSFGFMGVGNFAPPPENFTVFINSASRVTLSWGKALNNRGGSYECLGFYVFSNVVLSGSTLDNRNWVKENILIPYNDDVSSYNPSLRHTYTKTVSPSTTYYFSVAAVYNNGRGQLATPIMITTPDPPITVTGLTATAYSSTSINLSWNSNEQATAYKIYYEKGTSTVKYVADTVLGTNFSHTGLDPDTEYRYSLRAVSIDKESSQFSNTTVCRTLATSFLSDPLFLIIENISYVPIKTVSINNGENCLLSNLYRNTSSKFQLVPGTYSISVYDIENRQLKFIITINSSDVRYKITDNLYPLAELTVKNNYAIAISSVFLRIINSEVWGTDYLKGNSLIRNSTRLLGKFNQGKYEAYAKSVRDYKVSTATSDYGMTITGGVISGYQDIYYYIPSFTLTTDTELLFKANGWGLNEPD